MKFGQKLVLKDKAIIVRVRTHFGYGMAVASDGKSHDTGHIPGHVT